MTVDMDLNFGEQHADEYTVLNIKNFNRDTSKPQFVICRKCKTPYFINTEFTNTQPVTEHPDWQCTTEKCFITGVHNFRAVMKLPDLECSELGEIQNGYVIRAVNRN